MLDVHRLLLLLHAALLLPRGDLTCWTSCLGGGDGGLQHAT